LALAGPVLAQPKWLGWIRPNLHLKKNPKISKKHFKKIVIFSNIFLPILHNIRLYIYTVKYKSGIKITGFLQNISKQIQNISKKISKYFKLISLF
jgi:hypothetical protein